MEARTSCGSLSKTVVKIYRDQLRDAPFDHLSDYTPDFVAFMEGERRLFPADEQELYFISLFSPFTAGYEKQVAWRQAREADRPNHAQLGAQLERGSRDLARLGRADEAGAVEAFAPDEPPRGRRRLSSKLLRNHNVAGYEDAWPHTP
jgi:hypothetical protein